MKIRPFGVLVHLYSGLAMTVFLVIVGVTGSFLAFYKELDSAINPQLYVEVDVQSLWMSSEAAQISVSPRLNAQSGHMFELDTIN
ncbi:PepSY domain-containing protein [Methylotuvimicrobium sp. KM1]|uniref:PepSY domain-containing protein n=1 Tax=Methylotuvimicrobium sp. KM1 TaxID=3377707 RepID=UPI00384A63D5